MRGDPAVERRLRQLRSLLQAAPGEGGEGGPVAWDDVTGKPSTFPPTVPIAAADVSGLSKSSVGLALVDNTADASKPVSTAQQAALDLKADIASPTFTGTPSAPTPAAATNSTQLATTAFVQTLIANLIASAPGALDTLDELAASLGDDANFAATMTTALAGKQGSDATLTALAGLAGGADKLAYFTGADVLAQTDLSAFARTLLDDANAGAVLTTLGLTANGQSLVTAANYAAMRTLLGLVIGTNVQAWDADLDAIAALATTAYGRALLTLADTAAFTALGNTFTSALKGLVPASGGGTTNFLRADGTFAAPSGGSDPWNYLKLALDYNNALNTFATITDGTTALTWTPPADTDWMIDARLLFWTTSPANLPRIGVNIAAGATRGYGGANIWQPGATATTTVQANGAWDNAAGVTNVQIAAGGVLTASVPYVAEITAHGRSGATPTAISLQMACETAAAATCYIKRGSVMRYRTI